MLLHYNVVLHEILVLDPIMLEGGGSKNVYYLYINENVDIFGWPINDLENYLM